MASVRALRPSMMAPARSGTRPSAWAASRRLRVMLLRPKQMRNMGSLFPRAAPVPASPDDGLEGFFLFGRLLPGPMLSLFFLPGDQHLHRVEAPPEQGPRPQGGEQ